MPDAMTPDATLKYIRTTLQKAMNQTPASLATWDRSAGVLTSILIDGVSWRWYAAGYVVPAGRTSVTVTATGGGVWVQGVVSIPGLLEAGTALPKGSNVWRLGVAWKYTRPSSHDRAQNFPGTVNVNGDVIASGNPVDVTGLGYVEGATYYIVEPDVNGKNFAIVPNPLTAAETPTPTKSFLTIGTTAIIGGRMILNYALQANIDPAAVYAATRTVFADLTYNVAPSTAQVSRLVDTGVANLTLSRMLADGDTDAQPGFLQVSPVSRMIGGVSKTVFLQDVATSGQHVRIPSGFENVGAGDFLFTAAQSDFDGVGGGVVFGASAALFFNLVLLGGTGLADYYILNSNTVSGGTSTNLIQTQASAVTNCNKLRYFHTRMNMSADRLTVKFKFWPYNAAKSLERQAEDEPVGFQVSYVRATAFPIGGCGWSYSNGNVRHVQASRSADPAVPAVFGDFL